MNHRSHFCAAALAVLALLSCRGPARGQEAELQTKINLAVDKGVEFLKKEQSKDGIWGEGRGWQTTGITALVAWTLLETGTPANDPGIQKAAEVLRKAALTETQIYNLSLMIFCLDHLGDQADVPVIQMLGLRLLANQLQSGGWGYTTSEVTDAEKRLLTALVEARKQMIAAKSPKLAQTAKLLPPDLTGEGQRLAFRPLGQLTDDLGDNSNTQFAMLSLWVARRYGVPTERAFGLVEARFRRYQWPDGRWAYLAIGQDFNISRKHMSHAMTCAGLLGLALGHANDKTRGVNKLITQDPQVRLGFTRLGQILDGSSDKTPPIPADEEGRRYYFLWSMERVGVVFDLKKIGGIDWYQWGVKKIIDDQGPTGSWAAGECGTEADTCFALLFLKKVNVAPDLTKDLRKKGGRVPVDNLLDLLPQEDTKKPPAKSPKKSSRLQLPVSPLARWGKEPVVAAQAAPELCLGILSQRRSALL